MLFNVCETPSYVNCDMHVALLYGIQVHVTKKMSLSDVFDNSNQVCCAFVLVSTRCRYSSEIWFIENYDIHVAILQTN